MRCQTCGLDNERQAVFCVYCGIRLETQPGYTAPAATGSTIDLGRNKAKPAQPTSAQQQTPLPPLPVSPPPTSRNEHRTCNSNWTWVAFLLLMLVIFGFKFPFFFIPFMMFGVFGSRRHHRGHWKHRHRHRW